MKAYSLPILFLSFVLILDSYQAQAQVEFPNTSFGIRAGGNANSWTNDFPALEYQGDLIFPDDWKVHFGGHLGVYANIRLSQLVALEPGILYTQKGTGAILTVAGVDIEGVTNSAYLDFPLLLRLYVADGFNIFLGPQFSYHLSSDFTLKVDGENVVDQDVTDSISEYDIAPILGLGYEFTNGLNINISGELGMLSVDGIGNLSTFNRNIRFSIGYSF